MEQSFNNKTLHKHKISKDFKLLSTQMSIKDSSILNNLSFTKDHLYDKNYSVDSFKLEDDIAQTLEFCDKESIVESSKQNKINLNLKEIVIDDDDSIYSFENFYSQDIQNSNYNQYSVKNSNFNCSKKGRVLKSTDELALEKAKKEIENLKMLKIKNQKTLQNLKKKGLSQKVLQDNFLHKKRKFITLIPDDKKMNKESKPSQSDLKQKLNLEDELNKISSKMEKFSICSTKLFKKPIKESKSNHNDLDNLKSLSQQLPKRSTILPPKQVSTPTNKSKSNFIPLTDRRVSDNKKGLALEIKENCKSHVKLYQPINSRIKTVFNICK